MSRYVYIPEAVILLDEEDERLKNKRGEPEAPITIYRWFVSNCLPVGVNMNPQTGAQMKVGPGKAFGDGDKAARAIAHIKKAIKHAEPGTYAALEHADWALWKKCCEEGEWMPGVSSQFLAFIDAVLDAKETPPPLKIVEAPLPATALPTAASPETSAS